MTVQSKLKLQSTAAKDLDAMCRALPDAMLQEMIVKMVNTHQWTFLQALARSERPYRKDVTNFDVSAFENSRKVHPMLWTSHWFAQHLCTANFVDEIKIEPYLVKGSISSYYQRQQLPQIVHDACLELIQEQHSAFADLMASDPKLQESLEFVAMKLSCVLGHAKCLEAIGFDFNSSTRSNQAAFVIPLLKNGVIEPFKNLPDGALNPLANNPEVLNCDAQNRASSGSINDCHGLYSADQLGELARLSFAMAPDGQTPYTPGDPESMDLFHFLHENLSCDRILPAVAEFAEKYPRYWSVHPADLQAGAEKILAQVQSWANSAVLHLCAEHVQQYVANDCRISRAGQDKPSVLHPKSILKKALFEFSDDQRNKTGMLDPQATILAVIERSQEPHLFIDLMVDRYNPSQGNHDYMYLSEYAVLEGLDRVMVKLVDLGLTPQMLESQVRPKSKGNTYALHMGLVRAREAGQLARNVLDEFRIQSLKNQ